MKLLVKDYKKGFFKARVEHLDDLWYLTYIIEKNDILKSKTYRKIKLGGEDARNTKVVKKPMTLSILVERIEFSKYSSVLRISGKIEQGPEDIPLGSYHTITLEEKSEFSLQKQQLLKYQIEKLQDAAKPQHDPILICVHDREEAHFGILKQYGVEILSYVTGNVTKKADVNVKSSDFFAELVKHIDTYDKKYNCSHIIVASPGFWREYMQKKMSKHLEKKIVYATASAIGKNGIYEVVKRPEIQTVLTQEKFAKEIEIVQKILEEIGKEGNVEYGFKEVQNVVNSGAVNTFLITETLLLNKRQEDNFLELEQMMKTVEQMQGEVHIISAEHEGGKTLDGLGGIAALLRYKIH